MSQAFDRLHPAIQHHIVNSLGWRSLRPLQEATVEPLQGGEHALLLAPTAGGKTEAAFFPLLSRMLTEDWRGLSVLYVCPLRALLNNLEVRLAHYGELVGRRVALWHGDTSESERRRILDDPPDCLLITPESLEVILISRHRDKRVLFGRLRAVVVDEIHAFAGDDRGWHLLAVLERIQRYAGRELQRVGLSATVGEPDGLLGWLAGACDGPRRVIAPHVGGGAEAEVAIDFVGTTENAATVIARLHQGEKRLVFCDSRGRVEAIAAALRKLDVDTFVSHSSLGREERRQAEQAFAERSNCVIVSTSTLELGIDVGDLDRVIQIDAPTTVAGFLQRLGRTGRRAGVRRNCLFLTTTDDALLRAAAIATLWKDGYVEPVSPPASPYHILAQQIMALAVQEGGVGHNLWQEWIGRMPGFVPLLHDAPALIDFMVESAILSEDEGLLWLGARGEDTFGRRNFLELFSVFTSEPLVAVRHGRTHLGEVDVATFTLRHQETPILLLAGRSWVVTHIDWDDRIAYVEPTKSDGRSRWLGSGQPLSFALCRAIRAVLTGRDPGAHLSNRAVDRLAELRESYAWVESDRTVFLRDLTGNLAWWTFAGLGANAPLAARLRALGAAVGKTDNLMIRIEEQADPDRIRTLVDGLQSTPIDDVRAPIEDRAIDDLKFSTCLPRATARRELEERLTDRRAVATVLAEDFKLSTVLEGDG